MNDFSFIFKLFRTGKLTKISGNIEKPIYTLKLGNKIFKEYH